jgi:hypothetical protein
MPIPEVHSAGIAALAVTALLMLGACATTGKGIEETVTQRAQARWDALLADDVETAWGYFTPGYRSGLSLSGYYRRLAAMRLKYTGARALESDCSENSCKVRISVDYSVFGAVPGVKRYDMTSNVTEDWIFTDGDWYHLPQK